MNYIEKVKQSVFENVLSDIGEHYKVSDRLYDIIVDSLSEHIPSALQKQIEMIEGEVEKRNTPHTTVHPELKGHHIGYNQAIDDILSHIDSKLI